MPKSRLNPALTPYKEGGSKPKTDHYVLSPTVRTLIRPASQGWIGNSGDVAMWDPEPCLMSYEPCFIQNQAQVRFWVVHAYPEPCLGQIYVLGYAETIQNHA
ncbi:hypothetical protein Bbelb_339730 [Branchiostoma belcheri]|nr:hypothetical protein Bbelb_339730 [Branchiostoma belcheri]